MDTAFYLAPRYWHKAAAAPCSVLCPTTPASTTLVAPQHQTGERAAFVPRCICVLSVEYHKKCSGVWGILVSTVLRTILVGTERHPAALEGGG
jgi:hypothetical protein